jgi:hypothetical protein
VFTNAEFKLLKLKWENSVKMVLLQTDKHNVKQHHSYRDTTANKNPPGHMTGLLISAYTSHMDCG